MAVAATATAAAVKQQQQKQIASERALMRQTREKTMIW
jgi:hypothetical protein